MGCEVYKVSDIMVKLDISKNIAYELVKQGLFPVLIIKGTYRIPRKGFDEWLNGMKQETTKEEKGNGRQDIVV